MHEFRSMRISTESHTRCHCAMCIKFGPEKFSPIRNWMEHGWKIRATCESFTGCNPELGMQALIEYTQRQTAQCTFAIHFCRSGNLSRNYLSYASDTNTIVRWIEYASSTPTTTATRWKPDKNVDQCDLSKCECHNENKKKTQFNLQPLLTWSLVCYFLCLFHIV